MVSIVPGNFTSVVEWRIEDALDNPIALAGFLIAVMFMIDVCLATVGYMLTFKPLDSHIRTANPYLSGWLAALICYPPFVLMGGGGPLDYHAGGAEWDVWTQGSVPLQWILGGWLVLLTGLYAWATVAFGLRFSNLTYRGVLTNGPYAWTQHPAYLAKNAYWWLATLPFLVTNHSLVDAVRNTVFLGLVSAIYFWRAKTEERHLLGADPKYREYHAWMGEHAPLVRGLAWLGRLPVRARGMQVQPAE
jgi:protein-S-isoprenylcysteine O-methyltransferase Ste14